MKSTHLRTHAKRLAAASRVRRDPKPFRHPTVRKEPQDNYLIKIGDRRYRIATHGRPDGALRAQYEAAATNRRSDQAGEAQPSRADRRKTVPLSNAGVASILAMGMGTISHAGGITARRRFSRQKSG